MNTQIFKSKLFQISAAIYVAIIIAIVMLYNLNLQNSILLFLAGIGILVLLDPLLKIPLKYKLKRLQKKQDIIDKHIAIAKRAGKKCYHKGKNKQHTVWANNHIEAEKIFRHNFTEKQQTSVNPFYYISKDCNNLQ
jgi:hypothetical protein